MEPNGCHTNHPTQSLLRQEPVRNLSYTKVSHVVFSSWSLPTKIMFAFLVSSWVRSVRIVSSSLILWNRMKKQLHFSLASVLKDTVCILDELLAEDYNLLGYCAVSSHRSWLTFQKCVLSPSSPWWWRLYAPVKSRAASTRLHGAISEKVVSFILASVRTWNITDYQLVRLSFTVVFFNLSRQILVQAFWIGHNCLFSNL
jgi:hypothetical protein